MSVSTAAYGTSAKESQEIIAFAAVDLPTRPVDCTHAMSRCFTGAGSVLASVDLLMRAEWFGSLVCQVWLESVSVWKRVAVRVLLFWRELLNPPRGEGVQPRALDSARCHTALLQTVSSIG